MSSAPTLGRFFEEMRGFLSGRRGAQDVTDALGPSASGTENLAFYRVLIERNHNNFLRGLFSTLEALVEREQPGAWAAIASEFQDTHNPTHWHPCGYTIAFPDFLAERRQRLPDQPALWEEIADFCELRRQCFTCPTDVGDGFDARLFVRQYTYPVPELVSQLEADPTTKLPDPQPKVVFVFRHPIELLARTFYPSAAGLAALARRQGLGSLPEMFSALPAELIDTAEALLVKHGVLLPAQPPT